MIGERERESKSFNLLEKEKHSFGKKIQLNYTLNNKQIDRVAALYC